jgi:hypothetical protein
LASAILCVVTFVSYRAAVRKIGVGTERRIVGTWLEVETIKLERWELRTTYNADGTLRATLTLQGVLDGQRYAALDIVGTWRVQDELLVVKHDRVEGAKETADIHSKSFERQLASALKRTSYSDKIVSVSETYLITQDPATGKQSVAERVR